jgi:GTP cyclohydrolase FolE2
MVDCEHSFCRSPRTDTLQVDVPSEFETIVNPEIAAAPKGIDVQASAPATRVSLSRVGVTGVEKVLSIGEFGHYHAELECYVDLGPDQAGVHMSRFEENVAEAIEEVVTSQSMRAESLAARIAELVRERQHGIRAEVSVTAKYAETGAGTVSGIDTQQIYTLLGTAVASENTTRTVTGVQACGSLLMTIRTRNGSLADSRYSGQRTEASIASAPLPRNLRPG